MELPGFTIPVFFSDALTISKEILSNQICPVPDSSAPNARLEALDGTSRIISYFFQSVFPFIGLSCILSKARDWVEPAWSTRSHSPAQLATWDDFTDPLI